MITDHIGLADLLYRKGELPAGWAAAFRAVPRHLFVPDAIWVGEEAGPRDTAGARADLGQMVGDTP